VTKGWLAWVACVAGCWSADPTTDGFTPDQWAHLSKDFQLPTAPDPCDLAGVDASHCGAAQQLAKAMFEDTALSVNGTVSCKTCHQPPAWIDTRMSNAVSAGAAGSTRRNSQSLLDLAYMQEFTWSGMYTVPGDVLDLAVRKPLASTHDDVVRLVRASYAAAYDQAFATPVETDTVEDVFTNLESAFTAFLTTDPFLTTDTPFDRFTRGEPTTMSDSAKRGFAVFVGRGTCVECHSGPLFSDQQFHATGVPQASGDDGRFEVTGDPADKGKFLTGTLRDIAYTAPYMHDGSLATLADVIAFYRRGGDPSYSGTRDPRIVPLDLTDEDAQDLEAFLRSLSDCAVEKDACAM
jgi:cytochrome c peroxidase